MRTLLVDKESRTARSIELMLRSEGYACDFTDLGEDAIQLAKLYDYDIILLDPILPDTADCTLVRRLRAARVRAPILILSGLSDVAIKVRALALGADDYLIKPFDDRELLARIQAIVRRSRGQVDSVIRTGKLTVNMDARMVRVGGKPLPVTAKEYQALELFSLRKGRVLTQDTFLDHLYGGIDEPESKTIDVFVCNLRKKLSEATGGETYIETLWGRGYVMRDPERARPGLG